MSARGAWLSGTAYATGVSDAVTGYDTATGRARWSVPLDGDICAASPPWSSKGLVAVSYRDGKELKSPCTKFVVIDITKGGVVWQSTLKTVIGPLGLSMTVAVTDRGAAIGWPTFGSKATAAGGSFGWPTFGSKATAAGGSFGFEPATGKTIWNAPADGCESDEHTGGTVLVTHSLCAGDFENSTHRVGHRDPSTGKTSWLYRVQAADTWITSVDPLVVGVDTGLPEHDAPSRLISLSPKGRVQATWKVEDVYDTGCGGQRRQCGGVLATADTLYLATHKAGGPDSIHAFDTLTGKRKWSFTPDTERSRTMIPVQTDGGGLIVHMLPTSSLGGEVLRLAEADGTATLLMKLPDPEGFGADTPDSQMMDADVDEPLHYEDQTLFKHIHGSFDHDFIGAPMTIVLTSR